MPRASRRLQDDAGGPPGRSVRRQQGADPRSGKPMFAWGAPKADRGSMAAMSSNLEEPRDIRMVLQRICRGGGLVHLKHESFEQDVPVYLESEERVVLGITDLVR